METVNESLADAVKMAAVKMAQADLEEKKRKLEELLTEAVRSAQDVNSSRAKPNSELYIPVGPTESLLALLVVELRRHNTPLERQNELFARGLEVFVATAGR